MSLDLVYDVPTSHHSAQIGVYVGTCKIPLYSQLVFYSLECGQFITSVVYCFSGRDVRARIVLSNMIFQSLVYHSSWI